MGWKVFAVLNGLIVLKTIFDPVDEGYSPFEMLSIAISIPAAIGLALYAFRRRWLPSAPWKPFSWLFAVYSVWAVGLFLWNMRNKSVEGFDGAIGMIGAFALVAALQYFTWLALWRYSNWSEAATAR